ncbi:hypothetical protein ABIE09_002953 [Lysobacter enzymogenes]|uniref:hypothetical protein n=1 Tax=Lysobacter enzymogenes TaxID=69 RepID=UPI00339203AF
MNASRCSLFALGALALAGCATLEQAPLVYSSKTSVGVDIATTATETPGLSMSVGFKQVDAAYVPVAVSKACSTKDHTSECKNGIHDVYLISGNAKDGAYNDSDEETNRIRLEEIDRALNEFKAAAIDVATAEREQATVDQNLNDIREKIRKAGLDKSPVTSDPNIPPGGTGAVPVPVVGSIEQDLMQRQDTLMIEKSLADQKLKNKKLVLDVRRAASLKAQNALYIQGDSYSVFGSFESKSKIKAPSGSSEQSKREAAEASVGLGKIFATGVASQNISRGLEDYYRDRAAVLCLEAMKGLQGNMLAKAISDCAALRGSR